MVQNNNSEDLECGRLILHYAVEAQKFEIEHFWKRSIYFWGLVAAALVAFAALDDPPDGLGRSVIVSFGFLTSVAWSLQSRGSKYWQEAWEQKVNHSQLAALGIDLFENKEPLLPLLESRTLKDEWLRARGYSVSKLAIATSDISVVLWLALAGFGANLNLSAPWDTGKCTIYIGAAAFAAALLYFGRSARQPPNR